jgi:ABC-type iron transport system FetAB permease component
MKILWNNSDLVYFILLHIVDYDNDVDNLFHILCAHSHCSHISQNTRLYAKYITALVSASFLAISLSQIFRFSVIYPISIALILHCDASKLNFHIYMEVLDLTD